MPPFKKNHYLSSTGLIYLKLNWKHPSLWSQQITISYSLWPKEHHRARSSEDGKPFSWPLTVLLSTWLKKTTTLQTCSLEYINPQAYPPVKMTAFLTLLALLPSDVYKKLQVTTSTFQAILQHVLQTQTICSTTSYPAQPSTALISTVTLISVEA